LRIGFQPAGEGGLVPWAAAWAGLLPAIRMHTLIERSYSMRTTMKRTDFPSAVWQTGFKLFKAWVILSSSQKS